MENKYNLKPFDKVLVRNSDNSPWSGDFFLCYIEDVGVKCRHLCLTTACVQCIPYEGNEHLFGTTDKPSEEEQPEQSQTENEKSDTEETNDNYGYTVEYFKQNDVVLCRDGEDEEWVVESFERENNGNFKFQCKDYNWKYCIPYEGNEHLIGTTDTPERYDPNKNTLFGVMLRAGYVLEFRDLECGILVPTTNGLAIFWTRGGWQSLKSVNKSAIVRIFGLAKNQIISSGEILWECPKPQKLTKAQIAEKLGLETSDFEIIE